VITVHLPGDLAQDIGADRRLALPWPQGAGDAGAVLDALHAMYPAMRGRVTEADGAVRRHINLYVGEQDARRAQGLATPVPDGTEVWLLKAVSGG